MALSWVPISAMAHHHAHLACLRHRDQDQVGDEAGYQGHGGASGLHGASVQGKAGSSLICKLQCGGVLDRADNLSHALQPAHFSRSACHGDEVGDQGHGKVPAARIRHAHQQLACGCGRQGWLLCAEGRLGANLQSIKSITQRRAPKGPCLRAPNVDKCCGRRKEDAAATWGVHPPDMLQMKGRTALSMPIWEPVKPCSLHRMPRKGSKNTMAAFCGAGEVGGKASWAAAGSSGGQLCTGNRHAAPRT